MQYEYIPTHPDYTVPTETSEQQANDQAIAAEIRKQIDLKEAKDKVT